MSSIIRLKDLEKLDKPGLQKLGAQHAQSILDDGFHDATVLTIQVRKAREYIDAFTKQLDYETRLQLTQDPEGWKNILGCSLSLGSTGDRLDYGSDPEYSRIKAKLETRKKLLDIAHKSGEMLFDANGEEVPKVLIKSHSKETLIVKL